MADIDPKLTEPLREDIVVSVCFSDLRPGTASFAAIRQIASELDCVYRFREIILVVDQTEREAFLPLVEQVKDVRLFVVPRETEYYERRVIAAEEAIGDVVFIGAASEIEHADVLEFISHTERTNCVTLATRQAARPLVTSLTTPIIAIGRIAGFKVNFNDFQTIALPRTLLNHVLAHEAPELALRFPPRDPRVPYHCLQIAKTDAGRFTLAQLPRRAALLNKVLVYLAPAILAIVSLTSSLLALLGIGFGFYVLGAWLLVDELAPGWLTTSAMLTISAVFMGLSTLGLSLGLQHILGRLDAGKADRVAEEINRIDLFGKVALDLNVELESDRPIRELGES
ncbi:MAG: hypothetical protein V2I27_12765 [Erythrobacter sp.]|jgi:hypothetical protein|nr:hypothetical protein [Erythrobacter sp.]